MCAYGIVRTVLDVFPEAQHLLNLRGVRQAAVFCQ